MAHRTIILLLFVLVLQSACMAEEHLRSMTGGMEPIITTQMMPATYVSKGKVTNLGTLPIYTVGTLGPNKSTVIMIYDIYGFDSGRTRQYTDELAAKGYYVVLPDFFRGSGRDKTGFDVALYTWTKINDDLKLVYDNLKTMGVEKWAMIGACWGAWVVWEASVVSAQVIGGVSWHPSLSNRASLPFDKLAEQVKSPQLVIATLQEPVEVKVNGVMEKTLKTRFDGKSKFITMDDMTHGFVPRGDLAVPAIKTRVEESLKETYDFLAKVNPVGTPAKTSSNFIMLGFSLIMSLILLF